MAHVHTASFPSTGQHRCGPGLFRVSVSAPSDEFLQPEHLRGPLGGVLCLDVVADGGAHERRRRAAGEAAPTP